MKKVNKKTVVISGAGSGLGKALSLAFGKEKNINLILLGRNKKKLIDTAKLVSSSKILCIPCDISNNTSVKKAFKKIKSKHKHIDILINNAGVFKLSSIESTSAVLFDRILKTNTYGTFFCSKEAIKLMKKKKNSPNRIINILSIVVKKNLPFNTAYAASKYAILGMMNSLSEELKEKEIYISNISPGRMNTKMWNKNQKSGQSTQEVADIIYYLSTKNTSYASDLFLLPFN